MIIIIITQEGLVGAPSQWGEACPGGHCERAGFVHGHSGSRQGAPAELPGERWAALAKSKSCLGLDFGKTLSRLMRPERARPPLPTDTPDSTREGAETARSDEQRL